jgi:hypothetical protein
MSKVFRVVRSIIDSQNGLDLRAGTFIKTPCDNWVARMGSSLKQELQIPKNATVREILATLEDAEGVPEAKEVSKRVVPNKAVGEAENK